MSKVVLEYALSNGTVITSQPVEELDIHAVIVGQLESVAFTVYSEDSSTTHVINPKRVCSVNVLPHQEQY